MSFDWYKHNPADYLHDVASMTLEQKGAYSVIINQIMLYDRPLADDDRHLARLIGCHVLKWRAIRQHLVAMDKLAINGKLLDVPPNNLCPNCPTCEAYPPSVGRTSRRSYECSS